MTGTLTKLSQMITFLDYAREDCYEYDHNSEFISFNARDIRNFYNIFIDVDNTKFDDRIYFVHLIPNSCDHKVITCSECDEMDYTTGICRKDIRTLFNILPEDAPAYSVICPACATDLINDMILPPCIKTLESLIHEHISGIWPVGTNAVKQTFKDIMNGQ